MPLALLMLAAGLVALLVYQKAQASVDVAPPGDAPPPGPGDAEALFPVGELSNAVTAIEDTGAATFGAGLAFLDAIGATVSRAWVPPVAAAPYLDQINAASAAQGLPDGLLARLLYQESAYNPAIISGAKISSAGALGIAQFMPATAADFGIDPLKPAQAIPAAAKYLRQLFDQLGSWSQAIAAYNWGPGNVRRKGIAAAPAETQKYVADITGDVPAIT